MLFCKLNIILNIAMKYEYKIIYDINKDVWNWRGALSDFRNDMDWKDNIKNADDLKIANQVVGLKKQPAEAILKPYLLVQKNDSDSKLNKFIQIAEQDFRDKFSEACLALERITKRPMVSEEFTFYVTTFPRMTVFFETFEIFMYDSVEGVWGMPIDGFLHEGLHFQFNRYWREDPLSPVYNLSDDKFQYIKEALTIVLDDDLKPLITVPDKGYASQRKYCGLLHEHWQKKHDFEKLVEYGLSILDEFIK